MKKLTLLIALFCTATYHLHADLFNGPWSPESQELAKVIQNSTMAIPEKFKGQEKEINFMRKAVNQPIDNLVVTIMLDDTVKNLLKNNPIFLESIIGIIKQTKSASSENIALVAAEVRNINLFTTAVKTIQDKSTLLAEHVFSLFSYSTPLLEIKNAPEEFEFEKELIKIIITTVPKEEAYKAMRRSIKLVENFQKPMDFILSLGFPINLVSEAKQTLLDEANFLHTFDQYKNDPDLKKTIDYLKSKGAKTYAEL